MTRRTDQQPTIVPFEATPAGQPSSVKEWANRFVWTDRMLAKHEQGVLERQWHRHSDKVYQPINRLKASWHVRGKEGFAGVDQQTVEQFRDKHSEDVQSQEESRGADTD